MNTRMRVGDCRWGLLCGLLGIAAAWGGEWVVPLDGAWQFAVDRAGEGERRGWPALGAVREGWRVVEVPHTWQVDAGHESHYGAAWYARTVVGAEELRGRDLELEFDAVYRDATIWVNGTKVGEHGGSGYTRFGVPVPEGVWRHGATNQVVVRVDNRFSTNAFPYDRSFDWAGDGGMIRSVRLRAWPRPRLVGPWVKVDLSADGLRAAVEVSWEMRAKVRGDEGEWRVRGSIWGPEGDRVLAWSEPVARGASDGARQQWNGEIVSPALWHFDAPRLYRLQVRLEKGGVIGHERALTFGVRRVEVKPGRFELNGEPMRLMGAEWMPGSDPRYGMAEGPDRLRAVLEDLKRLNVVLTRFHWQQDSAVFEFGDRAGLLIQEEVPVWGKHPLAGEAFERLQDLHLRETIEAHRHHPSIFSWGLANEIKGGSDVGRDFVRRGKERVRELDSSRLVSYASNTLQPNPRPDAGGLLDFVAWNEYYGTWYGGGVSNIGPMLDKIQAAFPQQGVVIAEYGLCECDPKHPVGDGVRAEWLRSHTDAYRGHPAVAGAIYFSYNDYRTHMGDRAAGSFQQRVHGVVDLQGRRKPSWEVLRRECSPIRALDILGAGEGAGAAFPRVRVTTRALETDLPAYTLRGYVLVWTVQDAQGLLVAGGKIALPDLPPGSAQEWELAGAARPVGGRIEAEVFRPTGYSVLDASFQ